MKKIITFIAFIISTTIFGQVGIGTTTPDSSSILDIESNDQGILIPRLTTIQRNAITNPANGLMIFNTDTNNLEFNSGTATTPVWEYYLKSGTIVSNNSGNMIQTGTDGGALLTTLFYVDKFQITSNGSITISGLPFEPSQVTFTAYANIETYTIDDDNDANQNNNTGIANVFGSMKGYAKNNGGIIEQQVIYNSGHGNSINDISRFASNNHAIGLRYGNQNGNSLGKTTASITEFTSDGFILNVDNFTDGIVVIFEAYR